MEGSCNSAGERAKQTLFLLMAWTTPALSPREYEDGDKRGDDDDRTCEGRSCRGGGHLERSGEIKRFSGSSRTATTKKEDCSSTTSSTSRRTTRGKPCEEESQADDERQQVNSEVVEEQAGEVKTVAEIEKDTGCCRSSKEKCEETGCARSRGEGG